LELYLIWSEDIFMQHVHIYLSR